MAVHYSCAPDDGACDIRNMLSKKLYKKKNIVHPVGLE
jgi:hypothetical protein